MLKEITKKLTMKKTFFTTQLESFFDTISQEYQDLLHAKELEISLLKEKNAKLERDVENLVKIKHDLQAKLDAQRVKIQEKPSRPTSEATTHTPTATPERDAEVEELKAKIKKLQEYISRGASAYGEHLLNQKNEALIKEITEQIKR